MSLSRFPRSDVARAKPSIDTLVQAERAPLERMLRAIAGASIAATLGLSAGCAQSHFVHPDFRGPTCVDERWQPLELLSLPAPRAHLAMLEGNPFIGMTRVVQETGSRCADASDPAVCNTAFDAELMELGRRLASTRGDAVERFAGADVLAVLGPIDTAEEALIRAWADGYDVQCSSVESAAARAVEGGFEVIATRLTADCDPVETTRFLLFVSTEGEVTELESEVISSSPGVCVGRKPEGLAPTRIRQDGSLGAHLAEIARLEASAVIAFEQLRRELADLGAPDALLLRLEAAASDEVRHAEIMSALAVARGGVVQAPEVDAPEHRSALRIAIENATEGCVRETYGAMVGMHQAACAADRGLRDVMNVVAEDELRHADLSWEIARWLDSKLDDSERAIVAEARERALAELRVEAGLRVSPFLRSAAGLPEPGVARAIVDQLASLGFVQRAA